MRALHILAALTILAGCKVAAPAGEYRWKVKVPDAVGEESKLHFTVETTQHGSPIYGVPYVWKVHWVGVEGIRHQGHSFHGESIRVKGVPGTATVLILAIQGDHLVEVARATFQVKPVAPPAD